jgi:hypothetical protein
MRTINASLNSKKIVIIKVLLVFLIIAFLLVVAYLIFFNYTGSETPGEMSSIPGETMEAQTHIKPIVISRDLMDNKPEVQGGVIRFNPASGEFSDKVTVQLDIETPLKSKRGDVILADIYYTCDGTEPSKTNGKKYTPGDKISLPKKGRLTIKARLISKLANNYKGKVYSQSYSVQPETVPSPINSVTDYTLLDPQTREEIIKKMKRIVFEVEGITRINRTGDLKLLLSISRTGQIKLLNISGFDVEPPAKMNEIKFQLDQKIRHISFAATTMNGKPVDVRAWVSFNRIATFYEKVIIEGIGQ